MSLKTFNTVCPLMSQNHLIEHPAANCMPNKLVLRNCGIHRNAAPRWLLALTLTSFNCFIHSLFCIDFWAAGRPHWKKCLPLSSDKPPENHSVTKANIWKLPNVTNMSFGAGPEIMFCRHVIIGLRWGMNSAAVVKWFGPSWNNDVV